VRISIVATWTDDGCVSVRVANERVAPPSMPSESVRTATGGIGLRNVSDRLAARYDGQARLSTAELSGGFEATVVIPLTLV
jgi:signal transduction histidine kinase